jgi:cysteinyl-tRNA synthetase
LLQETRELKKQGEKRHPSDFAIWMKADEGHIMRWRSPWSVGFPGWHLECSVMSTKYLGKTFDIHGGGNDLKFPHHENEIAQNMGSCQCAPARYWLHTNMLLMNGKKMSKSDGNTISPDELFTGDSEHVSKGYDPTIVRFFMMQSHYRSTLDLTDEGLLAAEKGYRRLMEAYRAFQEIEGTNTGSASELDANINKLIDATAAEMDDDFNTPKALARLFELVPIINSIKSGQFSTDELSNDVAIRLKTTLHEFLFDILGLKDILGAGEDTSQTLAGLMDLILDIRQSARAQRDWAISDKIRDSLAGLKIQIKDEKEGSSWSVIN